MHQFSDRIARRSVVVLVSDLLDKPEKILEGLNHLRFARHEVLVFHVMDPYELEFPFDGQVKFEGLEGYDPILCQPRMLRKEYLEALNKHILAVKTACERNKVDYALINTAQPLEIALQTFLHSRALRTPCQPLGLGLEDFGFWILDFGLAPQGHSQIQI